MSTRKVHASRTCEHCDQQFTPKRGDARKTFSFCSRSCHAQSRLKAKTARIEQILEDRSARQLKRLLRWESAIKACVKCGSLYHAKTVLSKFCSRVCFKGGTLNRRELLKTCAKCGDSFKAAFCKIDKCLACRGLENRRRSRKTQRLKHGSSKHHAGRAKAFGVPRDHGVTPLTVFRRDKWRCQICGKQTPERLKGLQQPDSPTLDHIVPMSCGGGHTWDNVHLACHACNMSKGAKPLGQLRLAIEPGAGLRCF